MARTPSPDDLETAAASPAAAEPPRPAAQAAGFHIEGWRIDPPSRRASRDDRVVVLEPKVLGVLQALAARAGGVVTRRELLDEVWPDVFVTEDPLNRAVSELRKLFADDARQPRVIETIPKSGYRLLAAVEWEKSDSSAVEPRAQGPTAEADEWTPATPARRRRLWGLGVLVLATAALAAGVLVRSSAPSPQIAVSVTRVSPLTSFAGRESHPALSPGGQAVAFSWRGPGGSDTDIYLRQTGDQPVLRLTFGGGDDVSPAWSPAGTEIAFWRSVAGGREAWIVPSLGGAAHRVYTAYSTRGAGIDWSPDGESLALSDVPPGSAAPAILLVSRTTGERRRLTRPSGDSSDTLPHFSPDGRTIAFRRRLGEARYDIFALPVAGGDPRRITHDGMDLGGFDWLPRGDGLVFSSNRAGFFELWTTPVDRYAPARLGVESVYLPQVVGSQLVAERRHSDAGIWRVVNAREAATEGPVEQVIDSTFHDLDPSYSPDGRSIAFVSLRSGSYQLWLADGDGGAPRPLTRIERPASAWAPPIRTPRWSPDGSILVFSALGAEGFDLFAIDPATGAMRRLVGGPGDQGQPTFASEARALYFVTSEPQASRLERLDLAHPDARATRIAEVDPSARLALGPGGSLYVASPDRDGILRFPTDGTDAEPERLFPGLTVLEIAGAPESLYVLDGAYELVQLDPIRQAVRWRRSLAELQPATRTLFSGSGLAVSPNGRSILFTRAESFESDLVVIDLAPPPG